MQGKFTAEFKAQVALVAISNQVCHGNRGDNP